VYRECTSRAIRLTQIQHFLHKNLHGITAKELARLCGVTHRTIQRDILLLQSDLNIPIDKQKGDRYLILGSYILPPLSFSLYEALVIFLASRLAMRQIDESNPHVKSALTKIASVLPSPLSEQLKQALHSLEEKASNHDSVPIFEQLAIAWGTRKRVKIHYRSLQSTSGKEWLLDPYFIDMTGTGYSTYVVGKAESSDRKGITTFKLDRIGDIEILDEEFEIPAGFDPAKLLENSWGIIWGEGTEVKLRFAPNVTRRLKESNWHSSQVIEDLPDGGCLFTVRVGSTLEMTPWIRGWGPDVEVLEPKVLRDEFRTFSQKLYHTYNKPSQGGSR
jgi:predicted DNA-binding transcriptional regulator YafY